MNIALILYFDEFETVNPVVRETIGHKIGDIYFALRNLPNEFNAILENIHLIGRYYCVNAKINGMDKMLGPFVYNLKLLQSRSIEIENMIVRGTISAFLFDNLGGNMICNFHESFNKTNFCRIFTVTYKAAKTMTIEPEELLGFELLNALCDD